jgi:hypothetical protein
MDLLLLLWRNTRRSELLERMTIIASRLLLPRNPKRQYRIMATLNLNLNVLLQKNGTRIGDN